MPSFRPALAIARATWRIARRSHLHLLLALATLLAALALPLSLDGDGTPEGLARILLVYPPAATLFLLTLATLFLSCAAVSREAEAKTLPLLLSKPVPRAQIWLGKWFAVLAIDALLLAAAALLSWGAIRFRLRGDSLPSVLSALADLEEIPPDVEPDVEAAYARLAAGHNLPADLSPDAVRDQLRQNALAQTYSILPNASREWRFRFPREAVARDGAIPVFLRLKCDASRIGLRDIRLRLSPSYAAAPVLLDATAGTETAAGFTPIPAAAAREGGIFSLAVAPDSPDAAGATLFFDPADGLRLRVPAGSFAANWARAYLLLFFRLALIAAIGTTLGTLFHLPVAAFLGFALLLVLQISGLVSSAARVDRSAFVQTVARFGDDTLLAPSLPARAAATAIYAVYRATDFAFRPLFRDSTLAELAESAFLPPRRLLRAAAIQFLLLPGALCLVSALVLRRREFPGT
jgi:hypothetical protein